MIPQKLKYVFRTCFLFALLLFTIAGGRAVAAPFTEIFNNEYRMDEIHLWITSGGTIFDGWSDPYYLNRKGDPVTYTGWTNDYQTPTHLGGTLNRVISSYRGNWDVTFSDDSGTFTMQWAELRRGVLQDGGTLFFDPSGSWTASTAFDTTLLSSVPVPTSMILLGSGIFGLLLFRRQYHQ